MKVLNHKLVYAVFNISVLILLACNSVFAQQNKNNNQTNDSTLMMRRHMIHSRSSLVMPFNMNNVTHYFLDTKSGGILKIKAKNPEDTVQIKLIRDHLKKEHALFSKGNFADPETLHGMNMPGLKILSSSKDKYKVAYKELFDGAQLTFTSEDPKVIKALHIWFAAQLRDHGKDAKNKE